jgi:hypothetical protein
MVPQIVRSAANVVSQLPAPRMEIAIRPAVMADIPFIDRLQKMHSKAVGFMHLKTLEGNVSAGKVLVAWASRPCASADMGGTPMLREEPVGYVFGNDRYFKHDDVGIIYQMNVVPEAQRSFVGAALLKAQFERSAYGCKLYCCWCAKDLGANKFWESMGFVPLAFRAGSTAKERVHIFWQKRIRRGDVSTPWWFPSKTDGGAMREDRMVLPIPPGVHWSEVEPPVFAQVESEGGKPKAIEQAPKQRRAVKKIVAPAVPAVPTSTLGSTLRFGAVTPSGKPAGKPAGEKPKKEPKAKVKLDPRLKEAARELKDRWLEQLNAMPLLECGKYEVTRMVAESRPRMDAVGLPHAIAA